jgi:hypothetical protein
MTIMHGRLWPVGSVQVGSFWIVAAFPEVAEPLTIIPTNARAKTVISVLLICICYSPLIEAGNATNIGAFEIALYIILYASHLSML